MQVLSRQQLFEMAWERPLTKVAADLGVTSTALKKTCRRHHIPTPSRGYWAAVAAGRVFPRPVLAPVQRKDLEAVRIYGAPQVSEAVQQAAVQMRTRLAKPAAPIPPLPDALPDQPPAEASGGSRADLAATAKAIAKAKARPGELATITGQGVVPMTITLAVAERALAWLAQLLAEAEKHGARLEPTDHGAKLAIDGEAVAFRIEEKQARSLHIPTANELAKKASYGRWGPRRDPWPKYDYSPCGQLAIVIDPEGRSNLRRTYADGKTRNLERMTGEIVVGFAAHAASIRERRVTAEASQRRVAEALARRERIRAYEQREAHREVFVDLISAKLDERAKPLKVMAYVEVTGEMGMPDGLGGWLRRRLAEIDAVLGGTVLGAVGAEREGGFRRSAGGGRSC